MATRSTAMLNEFADAWEDDLDYPSAVLSGIVGDARHRAQGGYHISIEDNPSRNYSIVRVDDKAPPGDWPRDRASAVDMSMAKADMVKCYKRVHAVWSNPADPRRKFFNAFNVWDGSGDAVRLDFVTGRASFATSDHKWHDHGEFRRRYVNSLAAKRAALSMLSGESVAEYLGQSTTVPVPSGSPLLQAGSTGTAVRQLQNALREAIDAGLNVDGDFGPATEAALKTFQRSAGLTDDGIYGPATAGALRAELEDDVSAREVWIEDLERAPDGEKRPAGRLLVWANRAAFQARDSSWANGAKLDLLLSQKTGITVADITVAVRAALPLDELADAIAEELAEALPEATQEQRVAAAAAGVRAVLGSLDDPA